jgi:hypothetical protein
MPRWARWSMYGCTALTVLFAIGLLLTTDTESSPFLYAIF